MRKEEAVFTYLMHGFMSVDKWVYDVENENERCEHLIWFILSAMTMYQVEAKKSTSKHIESSTVDDFIDTIPVVLGKKVVGGGTEKQREALNHNFEIFCTSCLSILNKIKETGDFDKLTFNLKHK